MSNIVQLPTPLTFDVSKGTTGTVELQELRVKQFIVRPKEKRIYVDLAGGLGRRVLYFGEDYTAEVEALVNDSLLPRVLAKAQSGELAPVSEVGDLEEAEAAAPPEEEGGGGGGMFIIGN